MKTFRMELMAFGLVLILGLVAVAVDAPVVRAYSLYGDVPAIKTRSGTTTLHFDPGSAWSDLSSPFRNFFVSIRSIRANDISQFDPSKQIAPMVQAHTQGTLNELSSRVDGWLKHGIDWMTSFMRH